MTDHAVLIAGGGPTGMTLAGELALAGIDVAIIERRASQDLTGSRAGGLHARTIEVFDQRGIAERFISQGQPVQVVGFQMIRLDLSDFPSRHPHTLGLWQAHIERILVEWLGELKVPIYRGREVSGFKQDDTGVDVELSDGRSLRATYLVGADPSRMRSYGLCSGRHGRRRRAVRRPFVAGDVPRRVRRRSQPDPQASRHRLRGLGSFGQLLDRGGRDDR